MAKLRSSRYVGFSGLCANHSVLMVGWMQTGLVKSKFVEAIQSYQQVEQQYRQKYKQRMERQFKIGAILSRS